MITESKDTLKGRNWQPLLRPIEVLPVQIQGKEAICLRDPNRIAPQALFLQADAGFVLAMLNGKNDLRDIQAEWMRRFGQLVSLESIEALIKHLDEHLFLEGERFDRFLAELKAHFAALSTRPAILAGQSYEADTEALARQLESYYDHPSGPGFDQEFSAAEPPRGLVAPHIDFGRGGPCYAWSYSRLRGTAPPALVVILGTAHSPTENFLVLCDKDFETPFGAIPCEKDLARDFINRAGPGLKADEFVHRGEHSIEFQAVWLKNSFRQNKEIKVLPLLCGSFYELIETGRRPEDVEAYRTAVDILKDLLHAWEKSNGRVMILASVDLSHVGPQFGDNFRVTKAVQDEIRDHDLDLLGLVTEGKAADFYLKVAREKDRTHVCGLAPLYTMLRLLDGASAQLLSYEQWVDETGQGLVSFGSLVFP